MVAAHGNLRFPGMFSPHEGRIADPSFENILAAQNKTLVVNWPWFPNGSTISSTTSACHPVTNIEGHYALFDSFHQENSKDPQDLLRRVSFIPQLEGVNTEVAEQLNFQRNKDNYFNSLMTPHNNLFVHRLSVHFLNRSLNNKVVERHTKEFGGTMSLDSKGQLVLSYETADPRPPKCLRVQPNTAQHTPVVASSASSSNTAQKCPALSAPTSASKTAQHTPVVASSASCSNTAQKDPAVSAPTSASNTAQHTPVVASSASCSNTAQKGPALLAPTSASNTAYQLESRLRGIDVYPQTCNGGLSWLLPPEFSQTYFEGRNGSNACTLISLNLCYFFLCSNLSTPPAAQSFPYVWLLPIASSIKTGNFLYDKEGHRGKFLCVDEAMEILEPTIPIQAKPAIAVKFEDEHAPSTVKFNIHLLSSKNSKQAYVFTMDDRAISLLVLENNDIVVVDIHCHLSQNAVNGALILCFPSSAVMELCSELKSLFSCSDNYGSLERIMLKQ